MDNYHYDHSICIIYTSIKYNLSQVKFSGANLSMANLSRAHLYKTDLSGADLSGADLVETDLSTANMSGSIIIEPQNYENIKLDQKSNFYIAICDRIDFIYHISKFILPENIPNFVDNKKELKLRLEKSELDKERIDTILGISRLPE